MNIKQKLQNLGRKLLGLEIYEGPAGWVTLAGAQTEQPRGRNSFLEANIRAISTAFCNGEIRLHEADGEEIPYTQKGKNPLLDLLYQPAPFLTENLFKQIITAQFLAYGDVFILKSGRNTKGVPTILIPVPAPCVTIQYDQQTGWPKGYRLQTTTGAYTVGSADVMHIYEGNANNLFEGYSRAALCALDAGTIQAAKVFNLAFFKNGASVGGIVSFPEGAAVTAQEREELLAFFNDRHQGAEKAHRTAVLGRGGKYESFKTSHKDMEYAEGQKFAMQQIYSAMGVPPAMVGLFEYAPQFNTKEQQKIFYETTVIPMARLFSDAFNEQLVGDFYKDEGVYLEYDFSKVKALERDWQALAAAAAALSAIWPVNEVKRALDLPFADVAGGDEPRDPIMSAFGSFHAKPAGAKAVKKPRTLRPSPAQLKRHKAAKFKLINELGNIMRASIEGHFKAQQKAIDAWVKDNPDTVFNYDEALGGLKEQQGKLLAVKLPALSEIFRASVEFEQEYLQSLAPKKDFQFISRKDMSARVQKWAEEYAFKWAESIEKTSWERLEGIIQTGLANGMSSREINKFVLQFFAEEGYEPGQLTENANGARVSVFDRVQTIVQTETRATFSEAQQEAYRSTPYVNGKEWITTAGVIDHHEGHEEMDGQIVGVNDKFTNPANGLTADAPGQFGTPEQDINCLCDLAPHVLDED